MVWQRFHSKRKPIGNKDYYTYVFKEGNKILHGGITKDLEDREKEHQVKWPKGHIVQVGGKKTKQGALNWEKKHGYS